MSERYLPPEARGESPELQVENKEHVIEQSAVVLDALMQTIDKPMSRYGRAALFAGLLVGGITEGVMQNEAEAAQVSYTDNSAFESPREAVPLTARDRIESLHELIQDFEDKIDSANREIRRIERALERDRAASVQDKLNATDLASLRLKKWKMRKWIEHYNNRIDHLAERAEEIKGAYAEDQQEKIDRAQSRGSRRALERTAAGLYKRANAEVDQWLMDANIREQGRDLIVWDSAQMPHVLRLGPSQRVDGFFGDQDAFVITIADVDGTYTGIRIIDGKYTNTFPCTERGRPIK
jgi:prefoldin subunit 5